MGMHCDSLKQVQDRSLKKMVRASSNTAQTGFKPYSFNLAAHVMCQESIQTYDHIRKHYMFSYLKYLIFVKIYIYI